MGGNSNMNLSMEEIEELKKAKRPKVRIDIDIFKQLKIKSKELGKPITKIVNEALKQYLEREPTKELAAKALIEVREKMKKITEKEKRSALQLYKLKEQLNTKTLEETFKIAVEKKLGKLEELEEGLIAAIQIRELQLKEKKLLEILLK